MNAPAKKTKLINGATGHALDFDDTNLVGGLHATAVVLPAALALAEEIGASGADLLCAYIAGVEVCARLRVVIGDEHYRNGWHITSNVDGFFRGDYEYTGKSFGSFQVTSPQYINPSYYVTNLNAGVAFGPYEVSLFAKNLFDNRTVLQSPQINSVIQGYTMRPQTLGVSFQAKF